MDKPASSKIKKPYEPPHLIVYGTVRDLTQQMGTTRKPDSPPPKVTHTGPA